MDYSIQRLYLLASEIYLKYCKPIEPIAPQEIPPLDRMVNDIVGAYSRHRNRETTGAEIT